jgi:hypothetical protein
MMDSSSMQTLKVEMPLQVPWSPILVPVMASRRAWLLPGPTARFFANREVYSSVG